MFSVRHVDTDGRERILEVESIDRAPTGELLINSPAQIKTGKVFIMNDAGATVATYDFDKKEKKA